MQPSANWAGIQVNIDGLNGRTGATSISDNDYTLYPPFTELDSGQSMGETTNMFWLYDLGTFPLNSLIDDWSICYTAVDNPHLSLSNIGVFTLDIDNPTYTTDNADHNGIMFYNSCGYRRIYDNIPSNPYGTPFLLDSYRFYCPPYNDSKYVWTPNAGGARSSQGYIVFYPQCNVEGYAAPYKTFGIKSMFLEIRVVPYNIGGVPLPLQDYSLKAYMSLTVAEREYNPIGYAYARVWRRGNTDGTYTYYGAGFYDINAAITVPFSGNGYSGIGAYFNNIFLKNENTELYFPLFGNASGKRLQCMVRYNKQDNTADIFYGYNRIDNRILLSDSEIERQYVFTMSGTEINAEYLRQSCAAYGLFFCDDVTTDELDDLSGSSMEITRWTNDEMHLGIIESDGYTRGNYTTGADNANQPQFNWTDSTDSNFNPDVPPTPTENEYDTHTTFNTISDTATLFKRYVLNDSNVRQLGLDLFDVCDDIAGDDPNEPYKNYAAMINSNFLTNNPIDCIISLQRFPMSIPKDDNSPENIKLGRVSVNAIGYETTQTNYEYSFTGKTIFPCFGDSFLDYNPYTTYELYIPFCGTVRLDPADILYRQLNVYLNVDFSTGTCTGYVMSDNLVIETVSGNIAIDIPVTGIASATVNANLNNAIVAYQNSKIKQIENIAGTIGYGIKAGAGVMKFAATGDTDNLSFGGGFRQIMDDVRGNIGGDKANYDLQHQIVSPHVIGSASSVGLWAIDLNCRLICYYPTGDVIDVIGGKPQFTNKIYNYGIQNGFATVETNTIASYQTGLVVGVNPLLYNITTANGRPATQTELDMIENAIKEGVILPPVG